MRDPFRNGHHSVISNKVKDTVDLSINYTMPLNTLIRLANRKIQKSFKYCVFLPVTVLIYFLIRRIAFELEKDNWTVSNNAHRSVGHDEAQLRDSDENWKDFDADGLTGEQMIEYLKWDNKSACAASQSFGGTVVGQTPAVEEQLSICLDKVQVVSTRTVKNTKKNTQSPFF